jgi:hypothetical protein
MRWAELHRSGKNRRKRSLLVDGHGITLSIAVRDTNVQDIKLLTQTLDAIVIERPKADDANPQHLCADGC